MEPLDGGGSSLEMDLGEGDDHRAPRLFVGRTPNRFFPPREAKRTRASLGFGCSTGRGCLSTSSPRRRAHRRHTGAPVTTPQSTRRDASESRRDAGREIDATTTETGAPSAEHRTDRRGRSARDRARGHDQHPAGAPALAQRHEAVMGAVLDVAGQERDDRELGSRPTRAALDAVRRSGARASRAAQGEGRDGLAGSEPAVRLLHGAREARRRDPAARGSRVEERALEARARNASGRC